MDETTNEQSAQLEGIDYIANGNKYLTFTLGSEHYALDILIVNEIRGWEKPTLIPNSPCYVKGVTNLRGTIVPIIDLRAKFNVGEVTYLPTTVIIVIGVASAQLNRTMGFVVDAVSDVLNAGQSDIKCSPSFEGMVPNEFVEGLINVGDDVVTLLNKDQLIQLDRDYATH